jgi:hypothetical protein
MTTSSQSVIVNVVESVKINLSGSEIVYNGTVFDCNQCTNSSCCGGPGCQPYCQQCYICACQNKGTTMCDLAVPCGQFCNSTLTSSDACPCNGLTTNQNIYGPIQTSQKTIQQAQAELNNNNSVIYNQSAITAQLDPTTILACCQANPNFNSNICGDYWGPLNGGACDSVMTNYCNSNASDPRCRCLTSPIPDPECNDFLCRTQNTMKLSWMIQNAANCEGVQITCNQYIALNNQEQQNVINNLIIRQMCNTTPVIENSSNITIAIAVVVGVIVVLIIIIAAVFGRPKKKPQTKSVSKTNVKRKSKI